MSRNTRQPERPAQPVPGSEKHLVAWRMLRPIEHLLHVLRRADQHGNRTLHADHLLIAHLVAFFSPALKSLRRIEDVFDHPGARRKYALPRMPHSTVSDAHALFDPRLLEPLIADLRARVEAGEHPGRSKARAGASAGPGTRTSEVAPRLDDVVSKLLAVDGTFFTLAPRVLWALYAKPNHTARQPRKQNQHGNVRVDLHFNVWAGVPEAAIVTDGRTPEYRTLVENLQPGAFYVLDRGYHSYQMMADILAAGSDFLVRLRSDMQFAVLSEEPLSAMDLATGVRSCRTVRVCGPRGELALGMTQLRLVELAGSDGSSVRLLSSRADLSAEWFGLIYRHRWQVELFFRWLKCLVNFRHFFAESENGVTWQILVALIGTLLLALTTGEAPNSYDWAMMTHVASGLLPADEEFYQILQRRRAKCARAAARQKAYRASKKICR